MSVLWSLILIVFAGVINGSFALPTKHVTRWRFENIWLQYAIWAFVILPWVTIFILVPQVMEIYAATPAHLLWIMMLGGFLFGAGQVGFAFAMSMIGIGLAFVICLGLGTGLGFFLPLVVQHPDQMFTPFGMVTIVGTGLAIVGLIFSTYAGQVRDRENKKASETTTSGWYYFLGVFLAAIAGIFSAGQNFTFALTGQMQHIAASMGAMPVGAAMIMWPGFLIFSFIPYALYMLGLQYKHKSCGLYKLPGTGKYYLFALIMGACWFGSLVFYSKASQLIGSMGPVVGWPIFMVLVILMSNFWGWRHKEWEGCSCKVQYIMWAGLLLLIASVVVLGAGSSLHP